MTTKASGATLTRQREYSSAVEKEIGESLEGKINRPWSVKYPGEPLETDTAGLGIHYTPDFVITNEETGQVLAVEVKSYLSLSLPNIIKFQHIQSALEKSGADFFLVVHGDSSESAGADARLGEYGIHAVGVSRPIDAATEIEKQLATYS
jgi:hypothetical protein